MPLSNDLISQFVKITKDETKAKPETSTYGTVVGELDGRATLRLDGSDLITPASKTADVRPGDRVTVMIKNHTAVITGNLSSPAARVADLIKAGVDISTFEALLAGTATVKELNAVEARVDDLEAKTLTADQIDAVNIVTEKLKVGIATTEQLTAVTGEIDTLKSKMLTADTADLRYASVDELRAFNGRINTLSSDLATIDTLIFGSATGTTIQTSFANAVIAQLGDAQIKSAMIQSISASKISSGDIITNNVHVKSNDGRLLISDQTMQISDANRVRVQIGKDASNDYSINIWDASGNLMFSKGGITDSAIKSAIIRNDMVSETANISASKLDIDSLFEEINSSTKTIKSTRVYLDENKQTLDVVFKSLSSTVASQGQTITSQGTAISTIQGQITSKIWQQDINTASTAMSTKYSTLEQSLASFKTTVGNTYATNTRVSTAESSITQLSNKITSNVTETTNLGTRMTSVEQTASGLTARIADLQIGGRNYFSSKTRTAFNANNEYVLGDYQGVGSFTQFYNMTIPMKNFVGKKCILSFDCISPNGSTPFSVYNSNGDARYHIGVQGIKTPIEAEWTHQELVVTVTDRGDAYVDSMSDKIEMYATAKMGVKIKNVKFEIGDKPTDWTPAPEDVSADILNASKTATNYLNLSTAGLVVGNHTASTLGKNVLIDSEAVKVRTGSTVNAVFGADIIELAKNNESATISMLNGAFKIYYDNTIEDGGFGIYGRTTSGQMRLAFQPVNENNNLTLGWGGYADKANSTNLYGHKMYLTTNEDIILNPGSGNVQMDGNVVLTNGKNLFGRRTDGIMRSLAILNSSNQMLFGYGSYSNNEGTVFYDGNDVTVRSKNDIRFTTANETVMLQDGDGNATYSAFFKPNSNAKCTLGTNANRWYAVYASNATIQTSDAREKENLIALDDRHSKLFDKLRPVQFNFINGNGRRCYGLIAQEVLSAMEELGIGEHDLDLVHHDTWFDKESQTTKDSFGLAYANLIAMLIYEVQQLKLERRHNNA